MSKFSEWQKNSRRRKFTAIMLQCSEKDYRQPVQFITCKYSLFLTIEILKATSTLTDSLFSSSDGALGVEAGGGGGGASPFSSPAGVERMKKCYQPQNRFTYYRNTVQKLKKKMCVKLRISYWYIGMFLRSSIHELMSIWSRLWKIDIKHTN